MLTLLCVFCTCAFFVACSSEDETEEDTKTYSYTEEDTENISNGLFAYDTTGKTESDYPITSPTGWSRTTDNSAATSGVTSGVINVESWDAIFDKIYSNNTFSKFCQNQFPTEFKDSDGNDIPAETSKASISTKFKPTKYSNDADNYMFMLNNYSTTYEGTAQKVTSSSTVSVKKGEIYEISLWVKAIIFDAFETGAGANVRITPTVDGKSQADFQINKIAKNDWQKYTVYFVADDTYDCSFKITLGLGYGNGSQDNMNGYVEGTVFFDDVTLKKVDALPTDVSFVDGTNQKTLVYGSEDAYALSGATEKTFAFNATFATDTTDAFFTYNDDSETTLIVKNTTEKDDRTVIIKNAGSDFVITTPNEDNYEKFAIVSFKLLNKLDKLGSTDITVNVVDKFGAVTETRKAVATFSDVSDDYIDCYILIKNNFKNQTRNFYLEIVVGPETLSQYVNDNASGTVKVKEIKFASGFISSEQYADKEKDVNYKLYSFYSAKANGTTALYAGYEEDYSEHNHSSSFSLTPTSGSIGKIVSDPTAVKDYSGITTDHVYVKEDSEVYAINERLSFTGTNGYAGLINTKYSANYPAELMTALTGLYDDDIQPLVIYNKTADNYGFIGAQQTVSASDYAKVTLKLKVSGDAKAYIYLVDTSDKTKQVLTFADFTVNTEFGIANASINKKSYTAGEHKYELVIDKDSPVGTDNWVEVNFYLATGATEKNFRVEIWNGDRTGAVKSQGYVIVNSIDVSTSGAFSEPSAWTLAFDESTSPLLNRINDYDELIAYTRELTDTEKQFNEEYPDKAVSYKTSYIWADGETFVYGVYNTIDPVETNPYDSIEEEEEGGCAAESDPSTFWLSFSSIVLAAVLILAIIALFVKNLRAKRKSTKSDVKAQYKVKSRTEAQKAIKQAKEKQAKKVEEPAEKVEDVTETAEEAEEVSESTPETAENEEITETENTETNGDDTEQTGYVYGEVQDFGDMTLEMPEEKAEEVKPEESEKENKDE